MQFLHGDLSKIKADAVVISANPEPICGEGVDAAIFNAAGQKNLIAVRKNVGRIDVGQAVYTRAFSLPAKYIIHTVSPMWRGGRNQERELLGDCFYNCLKLAESLGCKSIAFPLIGTKSGRIPRKEAIQIARVVFEQYPSRELDIRLVLYDEKSVQTAKTLYPDIEIKVAEDETGGSGRPGIKVDTSVIWDPKEHNLHCEQKNIQKYQQLNALEEIACKKGDNGKRLAQKNAAARTMRAFRPGLVGGILIEAVSMMSEQDEKSKRTIGSISEVNGSAERESIVKNIALSRLLCRELKIERNLFESSKDFTDRICADFLSKMTGDSKEKILKNFQFALRAGLKNLAVQQLYMTQKYQETEYQFCERCMSSLRHLYNYEEDDRFILIAAYLKRSDLSNKMKKIFMESQSVKFFDDWELLSSKHGSVKEMDEAERLSGRFYELLKEYIMFWSKSISSESQVIQSDYYKVRNYLSAHREDWLYAVTPSGFLGLPYDALTAQYSDLFGLIYLKFHAMLEAAGMLEDFQSFCDLSTGIGEISSGMKLVHQIYKQQCHWYIENKKNTSLRNGFKSFLGE